MSFRIVRNSKFRHVFGQALKREQCYDNIRITKNSWDSNFCAINPKFIAIVIEAAGGGAFLVLPLCKTGRIDVSHPMVAGHRGPVLDIAWCPFNDNVIASASEDGVVRCWQIPDGGLVRPLVDPAVELIGHQRRAGLLAWHPSANNILLSAGADCKVIIWNVGVGEIVAQMDHPDLIYYCSWSWDGSRLVTTCKDKKIRVFDPRTGELDQEGDGHEGAKPQRAIYLRNNLILTTGFSRMSERQYALRGETGLNDPIVLETLDTSNGVMFPFYDPDVNLLYLCAKGDSNIRYFEITDEPPFVHYISTYQSTEPQRGIGMMPKRGCDVHQCEIARFFKLHSRGLVEVISFTVPRKSELFQDDLYPNTAGDTPALTADEWIDGKDAEPVLMSLKDGFVSSTKKGELKVSKKPNILDKGPAKTQQQQTPAAPVVPAISNEKVEELMEELKKIKLTVVKHEMRIREMEKRLEIKGSHPPPGPILLGRTTEEKHETENNHDESALMPDEV